MVIEWLIGKEGGSYEEARERILKFERDDARLTKAIEKLSKMEWDGKHPKNWKYYDSLIEDFCNIPHEYMEEALEILQLVKKYHDDKWPIKPPAATE